MKSEYTIHTLRELAKTARDGYTGLAAHDCDRSKTEMAQMIATIVDETVRRLLEEVENSCPYTHSHTRHWCGYHGCRDS